MTSYVVYYQIISGDNIIINPKYKIDMIACVINMILIAVSLQKNYGKNITNKTNNSL